VNYKRLITLINIKKQLSEGRSINIDLLSTVAVTSYTGVTIAIGATGLFKRKRRKK
jgi:hypothetical protein